MADDMRVRDARLAAVFQMEGRPRAGENRLDVRFGTLLFAWLERAVDEIPVVVGDGGDV